ncbi:MAG: hypothetical protein KIT26_11230 [Nitrosomonas sp.]|nr:hypothetical protein [Nitrosomonas sp.]
MRYVVERTFGSQARQRYQRKNPALRDWQKRMPGIFYKPWRKPGKITEIVY